MKIPNRQKTPFRHFRPRTRLLICTENIRNRHNPLRISHLRFSNLYKLPAFFLSPLPVLDSLPRPLLARRLSLAIAFLIYGTGINFSRKLLKTKDRDHA